MAAQRTDVICIALMLMFLYSSLLIKKPSFCTADGVSITLSGISNDIVESYGFSSLLAAEKRGFIRFRRKNLLCLLLLACGDIESCPGPCQRNTFKDKDFTIFHQNVCGLSSKKDYLEDFLICNNIKLFGVTETLLTQKLPSSLINIRGYAFERRDRNGRGGGVGVYIKEGIQYLRRYDLENDEVESIWIELKQTNAKTFIVGIVYRPPDTSKHLSKNFEKSFINCIKKLNSETKECIILGDTNINYLSDECHQNFKELIGLEGLIQMIKEPTRVTKDTKTLIDVIFTSHPENLCNVDVILSSLSDHDIIACKRKVNNIKISDITINCRDYKNYDPKQVNNELSTADWDNLYQIKNVNKAWRYLKDILCSTIDKHAPPIVKRVKGKSSCWITPELKHEMNRRDSLHRKFRKTKTENDYDRFKRQRNRTNLLVNKAKNNHHKTLLNESAGNSQKFWKEIKQIYPTKEKSSCAKSFLIDGTPISQPSKIASKFCNFFTNMARNVKTSAILLKDFTWSPPYRNKIKTYTTFRFTPVTVNEVFKMLKGLQRKKSCGADNLPPGYLKDTALTIAKPLCYVINLCLKSGSVPEDFKIGKITPIFKSGSKHHLDNYRPITVLPVCSKILERCVHMQLTKHLEEHKLLSSQQFGFRKGRSTEIAATLFLDKIRKNMDSGKLTGAIFIDLSKAFDTLSHNQIIANLNSYGIHDIEKEFFINYLFNRQQQVHFQNSKSNFESVFCGVPQGSILGPLLFLLSFNDVGDVLNDCEIIMYADDTVIFTAAKNQIKLKTKLSNDFQRVADWLERNELVINMKPGKTECMIFGTPQKTKNVKTDITYRHYTVSTTQTYKYLGVELDQSLSLKKHCNTVYKKATGRLYLIRRLRQQLTTKAAALLYNSVVIPLFTYCSILTYQTNNTYKLKVKAMETRANNIIYKVQPLKIVSIELLNKKRICQLVFQCLQNDVCENLQNYFELMSNNTRNKNALIRFPKVRLETCKKGFYFSGAKVFNELPLKVRTATTLTEFLSFFKE